MDKIKVVTAEVCDDAPDCDEGTGYCLLCSRVITSEAWVLLSDGEYSLGGICADCLADVGISSVHDVGALRECLEAEIDYREVHLEQMRELLGRFDDVPWYSAANSLRLAQMGKG